MDSNNRSSLFVLVCLYFSIVYIALYFGMVNDDSRYLLNTFEPHAGS